MFANQKIKFRTVAGGILLALLVIIGFYFYSRREAIMYTTSIVSACASAFPVSTQSERLVACMQETYFFIQDKGERCTRIVSLPERIACINQVRDEALKNAILRVKEADDETVDDQFRATTGRSLHLEKYDKETAILFPISQAQISTR